MTEPAGFTVNDSVVCFVSGTEGCNNPKHMYMGGGECVTAPGWIAAYLVKNYRIDNFEMLHHVYQSLNGPALYANWMLI